jgi:predicted PurR-regulated permease PerM
MIPRFIQYLLRNQVILALFLICFGWFIYITRGIIASVFIAYIITAAMMPVVGFMRRNRFPRVLAVLIPYVLSLIIIFALIFPLIPFTFTQIHALVTGLPNYVDQAAKVLGININPTQVWQYANQELGTLGQNAFEVTRQVFGGVFSTLTIFIIALYMTLYHDQFKHGFGKLFHRDDRAHVEDTFELVDDKLGAWLRGQILLSLTIGLFTFIALSVVGLNYALPLALLAGFLEIIPTIGPILSAVPAVIVALTVSPTMALVVIGIYLVIQLAENNLVVPKIMQHAVGLNPVVIIIAIFVGAELLGITGALLSLPFVSFVTVIFNSLESADTK